MNLCKLVLSSAAAALALAPVAQAATIDNFTTNLSNSTLSELGRPYRGGVPQDWAGTETYQGVNTSTTATSFRYTLFTYDASLFAGGQYVQLTDTEQNNTSNYFLSAYAGSYDPNNRQANWLGDQGIGGNYQTNDGETFQVVLPSNTNLVLMLTSTTTTLNTPIQILVENFSDTDFDDPVAVTPPSSVTPEPSSFALLGTGLLGAVGVARRRFRHAA